MLNEYKLLSQILVSLVYLTQFDASHRCQMLLNSSNPHKCSDWLKECDVLHLNWRFISFCVQLNSPDEGLGVSRTAAVGLRQDDKPVFKASFLPQTRSCFYRFSSEDRARCLFWFCHKIMFLFWVLMKLKLFIYHTLAGWVCLLECHFFDSGLYWVSKFL